MKDFYHLFVVGLQSVYSAENQIAKALPKMVDAAKDAKLKEALHHHLDETKEQIKRLEEIAKEVDLDLKHGECHPMEALLKEGQKMMAADLLPEVKDAALIAAAQSVEHFEIAAYGTLKAYAQVLKQKFAEEKLNETLEEEKTADQKLSAIAQGSASVSGVNKKANTKKTKEPVLQKK